MFVDDSPEITYQELTTPAIELFGPDDDYLGYVEAVKDDLEQQKLENYNSDQLDAIGDNLNYSFDVLLEEKSVERLKEGYNIYRDVKTQLDIKWLDTLRQEFDQKAEQERKERQEYTLEDFVKNPTKGLAFRSIWREMAEDMSFEHLFSGGWKSRAVKTDLTTLAAFGLFSFPHEMVHAGVNLVTGGVNEKIVINTFYGGSFWEKLIPGVESQWMVPFLGGYVQTENSSAVGMIATAVAPYVMTPVGIYLAKKGKEKESIVITAAGAGLLAGHLGGVIGDWRLVGQNLIKGSVEVVQDTIGVKTSPGYETEALIAMALGGLYVGSKILAISYRGMKATVNSVRNYVAKEN